ncbi:MAG TPA: LPS assembly lipoprotein LptE [Saprospiraceae bacterium]|nr:LPS assembly lipoprotein LptE [Saprospiraceae bacterium]HRG64688.1 LPS assembly lipoprotein LptE [Saprospiraceae bacterium]
MIFRISKRKEVRNILSGYVVLFTLGIFLSSCYGFKGITIPADVNTFYVENFDLATPNAPVEIDVQFSEAMRTKIRNQSRLKLREADPDVEFGGQITGYRVTAEAPKEGNTVALNKLEIVVQVQYTNHKNEKENYSRSFSFFRTFEADQDLQSVQEALNKDIINQLTEKIFNETFASW